MAYDAFPTPNYEAVIGWFAEAVNDRRRKQRRKTKRGGRRSTD